MKIVDELLLESFRAPGRCEYCGHYCQRREPHHIFSRGMGGGSRLDVRINLISLCPAFVGQECHNQYHAGHILRCDLLAIVAKREGRLQTDIEAEIYKLRRARKAS